GSRPTGTSAASGCRPAPSRTSSSTSPDASTAHDRHPTERRHRMRPFLALSVAIVRGFVRDKSSVFFAVIFPLMFLVLFGGLFSDQTQSEVEMLQVGDVALIDQMPAPAREAFDETFEVTREDDLEAALEQVRKGDA